ncbi:hypothetical protein [Desulfocurvus sp. DL9XJH121]
MRIHCTASSQPLPTDRAFVISMVIRSFKGRRNVEVHLFRPEYDAAEESALDWNRLLGDPVEPGLDDPVGSRKVLLEAFTKAERDAILDYLKAHYEDRVTEVNAQPMNFPIPLGLTPLSAIPEGKTIGLIRFSELPNYDMGMPMSGLYDLSRAEPLVEVQE